LYEQALAIDPDYAAAWAGMARTYRQQANAGLRPFADIPLGREAANRALAIDPGYADAHATLAWIASDYDGDPADAVRHYQRALALDPTNPDIIVDAAVLARDLGRLHEAITLLKYAVARDPVNPVGHQSLATSYLWAGRLDEAIASYRTALTLSPGRISAQYGIGTALLLKGEPEPALAAFALAEFESAFSELRERWGDRWPSEVAHVYAWIRDADAAFEWLDMAVLQNEDGLNSQFLRPFYAPVHTDPRWAAFRERTGTSEAQLDAIEFEVQLPQ
jgi:Tfp pilus assembly protein PilF